MLKRSENKKIAPGLWACIGGHVEADEYINPEISCLREISEETGITVGQVDNLRLRYILIRQKGAEINQHYIFFGESSTRNIAQCEEGELHWISYQEIMNLNMPTILKLMLNHYSNNRECQQIWTGTLSSDEDKEYIVWARLLR